jgi:hypothetical protein
MFVKYLGEQFRSNDFQSGLPVFYHGSMFKYEKLIANNIR